MRMGALTLLLGLHLAVLSAHAAVRFTVELLKEDEIQVEPVVQSASSRIGGGGVRIIDRSTALRGSQLDSVTPSNASRDALVGAERQGGKETRQCPLCMECMAHPAAPPCGHLFCWECLHTWISSNSSSITGPNSSSVKCPVCRSLFKQQTVRALHGFS
jgi:RING-type zinc-finger